MHVKVDKVIPFVNNEYKGIEILWHGGPGFGHYTLYKENGEDEWHADSECMDDNDDKAFLTMLLNEFIKEIKID